MFTDQGFEGGVHLAGFAAVADGDLALDEGEADCADHHGGEGVGEFGFKHGAFAGDDAVLLVDGFG